MRVEGLPKIVHHPLADAGGQILFRVGADGIDNGDDDYGEHRHLEHRHFIPACHGVNQFVQPAVGGAVAKYIVQYNLQRPWLEQVGCANTNHGKQTDAELPSVGPEQRGYREAARIGLSGHVELYELCTRNTTVLDDTFRRDRRLLLSLNMRAIAILLVLSASIPASAVVRKAHPYRRQYV